MEEAVLLYDADCGFCNWSLRRVLAWDRRGQLRPVALQDPEAAGLLGDMPEDVKMASWHLVTEDGEVHSAGAAFPPLFRILPGAGPLAALTERVPGPTDRAYRWVAGHRSIWGRKLRLRARPPESGG